MLLGPLDDPTYYTRSAFTHLGLRRKMYDCSLHHFITSQCVLLKCAMLTFSSNSNQLAEILKGDLSNPNLGRWRRRSGGVGPFDRLPMGSCQLLIDTYRLSLTILSYLDGPNSVSARPTTHSIWIRRQIPPWKLSLRRAAKTGWFPVSVCVSNITICVSRTVYPQSVRVTDDVQTDNTMIIVRTLQRAIPGTTIVSSTFLSEIPYKRPWRCA